jgi:2-polyprenyl-3-methyl-5-hydroxy-6-metoxy-1,4-benzoquinol methylase
MTDSPHVVDDYGWSERHDPGSLAYLAPGILALIAPLGARRILDLGCGIGSFSRVLKDAGYDVVGADGDRGGIERARAAHPDIPFHVVDIEGDPAAFRRLAGDFDVVVSTEVVEHLFLPHRLPAFAHAVLRDGGHLLLSTPYHGYLKNVALAVGNRWDRHHHPLRDGGHIKFWSRRTLSALLAENGFRVERFRGAGRLPYLWKSMLVLGVKVRGGAA